MKTADFLQMRKRANELLDTGDVWAVICLYESVLAEVSATSQNLEQQEIRCEAYRALCKHLVNVQAYEKGIELSKQYYAEAIDASHRLAALLRLGAHHLHSGHYQQAQEAYAEAFLVAQEAGDELGRAKAMASLASILRAYGQYETAVAQYQEALSAFTALEAWDSVAMTHNRLGLTYQELGEFDKAIEQYERYYALLKQIDAQNAFRLMTALNNLAESYLYLFDYEQAQIYLQQALAMQHRTHNQTIVADVCRNYGMVLCRNGRFDDGLDYLHRAYELSQQFNQRSLYLQMLYSLAEAECMAGDHEMGFAYALRLQQLAEASNLQGDLAKASHVLGLCEKARGEVGKARQHWLKGVTIAKETKQKMLLWQLHQLLAEVAPSKEVRYVHRHMAAELIQKVADLIQDFSLKERFLDAPSVRGILQAVFVAV